MPGAVKGKIHVSYLSIEPWQTSIAKGECWRSSSSSRMETSCAKD